MGALKNPKFALPLMSHAGGTITATFQNGSSLSRLISADVTLVANTLYMVYLVVSGGAAALRISTNVNSAGPAGFTTWTLVGAFYSNGIGTIAFGSFIKDITSVPRTSDITFDVNINSQGFGTLNPMLMAWSRFGDRFRAHGVMHVGTRTAVEGRFGMPFPILTISGSTNQYCGTVAYGANTSVTYGLIATTGNSYVVPTFNSSGASGMNTGIIATSIFTDGVKLSPFWEIPIQGWANTPIVDL